MIRNLLLFVVGFALGQMILAAWPGPESVARYADQCGPEAMTEMRLYSAECVADGSAPVDCVERAKREFCSN